MVFDQKADLWELVIHSIELPPQTPNRVSQMLHLL